MSAQPPSESTDHSDPRVEPALSMIIGWREWFSLPEIGIPAIKAKIDTGARSSAIHALRITPFERDGTEMVRFIVRPLQRRRHPWIRCEARIHDQRLVRNSGGAEELRYVIRTALDTGPLAWPIDLTLTLRAGMRYRMLLGRSAMQGKVTIDPSASYLLGVQRRRAYAPKPTDHPDPPDPVAEEPLEP